VPRSIDQTMTLGFETQANFDALYCRTDTYLSQWAHCTLMKMEKWLQDQKDKYEIAIASYEKNLDNAIEHENPEGAERAASALQKAIWYVDEIIPLIEKHMPKPKKTKK